MSKQQKQEQQKPQTAWSCHLQSFCTSYRKTLVSGVLSQMSLLSYFKKPTHHQRSQNAKKGASLGESSPLTKGQTCIRLKLPNSTPFRCILKQKQEKKNTREKWQKKTKQARNKTTVLQYESLKNSKVVCKFEEKGYTFRNR